METMFYHAHSGLRFAIIIVGLLALLILLWGLRTAQPKPVGRTLAIAFMGLVDLQVLLGIVLVFTRPWYSALMGHLVLMIAAATAAHVGTARARRAPDELRAQRQRLYGVGIALLLMVLGIMAIGRGVFSSLPPTT